MEHLGWGGFVPRTSWEEQRNRGCEDILINLNEVYWTSFHLRIARESLQDADSYKLAEWRGEEQGIV